MINGILRPGDEPAVGQVMALEAGEFFTCGEGRYELHIVGTVNLMVDEITTPMPSGILKLNMSGGEKIVATEKVSVHFRRLPDRQTDPMYPHIPLDEPVALPDHMYVKFREWVLKLGLVDPVGLEDLDDEEGIDSDDLDEDGFLLDELPEEPINEDALVQGLTEEEPEPPPEPAPDEEQPE